MNFTQPQKNYYQAIAVLIGQIIGVGIFGLPYLASKTGALPLVCLVLFIGFIQYFIHLIYANIAIFTPTFHQLPGYTEIYLGKTGKNFVFAASLIGYYSALLAYLIVSGSFLFQLLSPTFGGSEFIYASLLFLVEAAIVFFGVHVLARVELIMTGLVTLVICLITWKSFDFIRLDNYLLLNWQYFLVPYGAVLFALDGKNVVPFVVELLAKDKVKIKQAIGWSIVIAGLITTCFTLVVIGVSGDKTTPNALIGMKSVLHDGIILLSLIFGVFCIFTSFLGSAQSLRKTYNWDYKINKHLAWFFTLSIPYLLYIIGIDNFVKVISFAGGVAGGIISIALIIIALKNNGDPQKLILFKKKLPDVLHYLLIAMFAAGIFYEIFCFVLR